MRKLRLVGIALTIAVLLVLPGSVGATDELTEALAIGRGRFSIVYDGYCDGVTLSFDASTGIVTGVNTSPCATCPMSDNMFGTVRSVPGQGVVFTMEYDTWQGNEPTFFTVIWRQGQTYTHYFQDGLELSGTWSVCPPGREVPAGAGSSSAP